MKAVMPVDSPSPVAFEDVYEQKDRWEVLVGCEGCEAIDRCCKDCPFLIPGRGCMLHLQRHSNKPFRCIVSPAPNQAKSYCQQEWLCVKGSHKGKIRRIREPGDVFHDYN